ncbi:MAG: adenosine deaminase [Lachnospiraceae bacterium]|nr:adenosine deaminase [Lachnospiraceae bacterium]
MDKKIPRIDLHCHLDGSLSVKSIYDNLKNVGCNYSVEDVIRPCTVSKDCNSLTEYLTKFDLPIRSMYDYESTKAAAKDFMLSLVEDNIVYVETRFAPSLVAKDGFSERKVLEAVIDGIKEGSNLTGIYGNIIICAMRHHSIEKNIKSFKLAKEYIRCGVCGVDLAGDENFYPTADFADLFRYAKGLGLNITIHAGECHSGQSIVDAANMGAARIGHGIAMSGNEKIQQLCRNKKIGIEMCPISNYQTSAVKAGEHYPFKEFMDNDLIVTINTDNRTVSGTTIQNEIDFLRTKYDITKETEVKLFKNSVDVCFASDDIKNSLLKKL